MLIPSTPPPTRTIDLPSGPFTPSLWGARLSRRLPHPHFLKVTGEFPNMAATDPQALSEQITAFVLA